MFSKRSFAVFILISLSSFAAFAEPIEVSMEDAAAPWSKKDGNGYANEILKAALNAVHVEAKYLVQPYNRCKANVISGETAACISMAASEEFKNTVTFSQKPLFVCQTDFFTIRGPSGGPAKNPEGIPKGALIGTVVGYEYPASVEKLKKRGIDFIEYPSEKSLIKHLLAGKVNYILLNYDKIKTVDVLMEDLDTDNRIISAFNAGSMELYVGFSKKHDRGEWLKKKFDEGFQIITGNGTLDKINQKWQKTK